MTYYDYAALLIFLATAGAYSWAVERSPWARHTLSHHMDSHRRVWFEVMAQRDKPDCGHPSHDRIDDGHLLLRLSLYVGDRRRIHLVERGRSICVADQYYSICNASG